MSASDERQMEDDNELLGKRLTVENFPLTDEGLRAAANRTRLVQLKFELATLQEGNCSACDAPINPTTKKPVQVRDDVWSRPADVQSDTQH